MLNGLNWGYVFYSYSCYVFLKRANIEKWNQEMFQSPGFVAKRNSELTIHWILNQKIVQIPWVMSDCLLRIYIYFSIKSFFILFFINILNSNSWRTLFILSFFINPKHSWGHCEYQANVKIKIISNLFATFKTGDHTLSLYSYQTQKTTTQKGYKNIYFHIWLDTLKIVFLSFSQRQNVCLKGVRFCARTRGQ